jgi:hypothetical protein
MVRKQSNGVLAVFRHGYHLDIGLAVQNGPHAFPNNRMVIDAHTRIEADPIAISRSLTGNAIAKYFVLGMFRRPAQSYDSRGFGYSGYDDGTREAPALF